MLETLCWTTNTLSLLWNRGGLSAGLMYLCLDYSRNRLSVCTCLLVFLGLHCLPGFKKKTPSKWPYACRYFKCEGWWSCLSPSSGTLDSQYEPLAWPSLSLSAWKPTTSIVCCALPYTDIIRSQQRQCHKLICGVRLPAATDKSLEFHQRKTLDAIHGAYGLKKQNKKSPMGPNG